MSTLYTACLTAERLELIRAANEQTESPQGYRNKNAHQKQSKQRSSRLSLTKARTEVSEKGERLEQEESNGAMGEGEHVLQPHGKKVPGAPWSLFYVLASQLNAVHC